MRARSGDDKKPKPLDVEPHDAQLEAIKDSVKRVYLADNADRKELERLLVTMLASVILKPDVPQSKLLTV